MAAEIAGIRKGGCMTAPPACAHEWREMRSATDPYRDDECKFCGVAKAEAEDAPPAPAPDTRLNRYGDSEDEAFRAVQAIAESERLPASYDAKWVQSLCRALYAKLAQRIANAVPSKDKVPLSEWQQMERALAARDAEIERMHAALRACAINERGRTFWRCYECGMEWRNDEPERHAPGCLAAERTQGTP
jgi:hypothetical protein